MTSGTRLGRLAALAGIAAGMVLVAAVPLMTPVAGRAAAGEALTVDLASNRGPVTGAGEGFLYGTTVDGSQPADQFVRPLGITAFRGGGHASGGWIADGYRYGSGAQADVNSAISQARRFTQAPYHAQYQVILSDIYGADGGQPSNTVWPCDNGNCGGWVSFIDSVVGALQGSGLPFAYDIWNEPDISVFWTRGMNSTQYFQMWDTAVREIRRIAPGATIVGPSLAFTPQRNAGEWQTWLAHTKAAATLPDMITNHDEGDVDDPVAVAQAIDNDLSANGIAALPLSANEYQPSDRQTAGVTAWYLARFAQSGYANAMRGNWVCCTTPNLTGVLTQSGGSWTSTGNWWVMRSYADMTGTLVNTSGQVGTTAISAAADSTNRRAVAIIGDSVGYTGTATVTFTGLGSLAWLAGGGAVNVTVDRIPDQAPLAAPQQVLNQAISVAGGSVTVPVTFQASHDAFAIYVTPATSMSQSPTAPPSTAPPSTAPPSTAPPSTPPTSAAPTSAPPTSPGGGAGCSASYQVTNSWPGGFQANVTVSAGASALNGWTVRFTMPAGQSITQIWNGTNTGSSGAVAVRNVSYNGTLAPGGSTAFGFLGSGDGSATPAAVTCTSP